MCPHKIKMTAVLVEIIGLSVVVLIMQPNMQQPTLYSAKVIIQVDSVFSSIFL